MEIDRVFMWIFNMKCGEFVDSQQSHNNVQQSEYNSSSETINRLQQSSWNTWNCDVCLLDLRVDFPTANME